MVVLRAWFASTKALVLLVCAPALAWVTSMQLLTPDIWQPSNNAQEPRGTALILYVTDDGGRTWKHERTLTDRGAFTRYGGALSRIGASTTVSEPSGTESALIVAFNDRKHSNRLTLMTVLRGKSTTDAAPSVSSENALWRQGDDIAELSFITSTWVGAD